MDKVILYAHPVEENHFALFTGEEYEIRTIGFIPLIDAHIHIQSNNTAPLTLQWCMLMLQLATFLNSTDEKADNLFSNIGYKNFNLKSAFDLLANCGIYSTVPEFVIFYHCGSVLNSL